MGTGSRVETTWRQLRQRAPAAPSSSPVTSHMTRTMAACDGSSPALLCAVQLEGQGRRVRGPRSHGHAQHVLSQVQGHHRSRSSPGHGCSTWQLCMALVCPCSVPRCGGPPLACPVPGCRGHPAAPAVPSLRPSPRAVRGPGRRHACWRPGRHCPPPGSLSQHETSCRREVGFVRSSKLQAERSGLRGHRSCRQTGRT